MYLWGDYPSRFYGLPLGEYEKLRMALRRLVNCLGWGNRTPNVTFGRIYEHIGRDCPKDLQKRVPWRLKSAARAFVETLDGLARENVCSCWLEKTPGHFAYIDVIRTHVPSARFIHLVRNPLDTIQSLQSAAAKYPESPAWEHFADLDLCLDVWIRSARSAIENAHRSDTFIASFDNALGDAPTFIAKIFAFMSLENVNFDMIAANRQNIARTVFDANEPWKSKTMSSMSSSLAKGEELPVSYRQYIGAETDAIWTEIQRLMSA